MKKLLVVLMLFISYSASAVDNAVYQAYVVWKDWVVNKKYYEDNYRKQRYAIVEAVSLLAESQYGVTYEKAAYEYVTAVSIAYSSMSEFRNDAYGDMVYYYTKALSYVQQQESIKRSNYNIMHYYY